MESYVSHTQFFTMYQSHQRYCGRVVKLKDGAMRMWMKLRKEEGKIMVG